VAYTYCPSIVATVSTELSGVEVALGVVSRLVAS